MSDTCFRLNKAIKVFERPLTFFLNLAFQDIQDPDGKKIGIDISKRKRKIAPFVSHCVEGVPIAEGGFSTLTLDPAYIRLKDAPGQCSKTRRFGQEPCNDMSAAEKLEMDTMDVLEQHEEAIQNRLEWMAVMAIVNGSYNVTSDHHPEYNVDFGRDPNNSLTIGMTWDDATYSQPGQDLEDLSEAVYEGCQMTMDLAVMNGTTYRHMMQNTDISKFFELASVIRDPQLPNLTPEAFKTVSFKGMVGDIAIWVYNGSFDDNGVDTKYLADGLVAGMSVEGLQGLVAYGEIENDVAKDAGMSSSTRFVDRWYDHNVGKKLAQTEAAPLVVPGNPDASAVMMVL